MESLTEEQKIKLKDRIITELFKSGLVQAKVDGICFRNHIHKDTRIAEDITQETFYYICKKSPDEIISMYYDDGRKPGGHLNRLLALSVTISVLKGVAANKTDPNYPRHSLARFILFGSNFQQLSSLSPTEHADSEDGHAGIVLRDTSDQEDSSQSLWELIRGEMSDDERETLDYFLNLKKKQGRYKSEVKAKYNQLLLRIEEIILKHRIHI